MKIDPRVKEGLRILAHQQVDQLFADMETDQDGIPYDKVVLSVGHDTQVVRGGDGVPLGTIKEGVTLSIKINYDKPLGAPDSPVRVLDKSGKLYELAMTNAKGVAHVLNVIAKMHSMPLSDVIISMRKGKPFPIDLPIDAISRATNLMFEPVLVDNVNDILADLRQSADSEESRARRLLDAGITEADMEYVVRRLTDAGLLSDDKKISEEDCIRVAQLLDVVKGNTKLGGAISEDFVRYTAENERGFNEHHIRDVTAILKYEELLA